jgi:hypothetical protein
MSVIAGSAFKGDEDTVFDKEGSGGKGGYPLSKFEHELFKDEDNAVMPIVRVKYVGAANKVEKWKIFRDDEVVFVVEGIKLAKKEKEFLRSIQGVNFLIQQFKMGEAKSFNQLKKTIKEAIKK